MEPRTSGPVSLDHALDRLTFLPDRSPTTDRDDYHARLASYRDGGVFVAHYAGESEWERHPAGDEIVFVIEGETTLFLLVDGEEIANPLSRNQFLVVPQGVWHRFETPEGVKVMAVTPQPTDHQVELP
jgi:mannose-6-phosphate isomerase-like protein (cupin superfamily)